MNYQKESSEKFYSSENVSEHGFIDDMYYNVNKRPCKKDF